MPEQAGVEYVKGADKGARRWRKVGLARQERAAARSAPGPKREKGARVVVRSAGIRADAGAHEAAHGETTEPAWERQDTGGVPVVTEDVRFVRGPGRYWRDAIFEETTRTVDG